MKYLKDVAISLSLILIVGFCAILSFFPPMLFVILILASILGRLN